MCCVLGPQKVQVRALATNIVLCSWARHFTLTVPLSSQVHKWVPANLMLGLTLQWTNIPSRGVEILSVTSCQGNWDKLQPDGPLGSYADFLLFVKTVLNFTKTFNHLKIHTAHQFCDFQCLCFLFWQLSMVKPV